MSTVLWLAKLYALPHFMDFNQLGTQMLNWIGWHPMISILLEELNEDTNVRQIIHPKNIQNDERSTNTNKDSRHDFSNQFQIQKEIAKDSNPIIILIIWTDFWIKDVQKIFYPYVNRPWFLEIIISHWKTVKNDLFLWERDNFNDFSGFPILVGIIIDPMAVISLSFLLCLNN